MKEEKRFESKLKELQKTEKKSLSKGDDQALGNIMYQMGDLCSEFDKLDEALSHYEKSLDLYEKTGSTKDRAAALLQISGVLSDKGAIDEGIAKGEEALGLLAEIGKEPLHDTALAQLGRLCKIKKDFKKALQYLEKGKQLSSEVKNRSRISIYGLQIGSVLLEMGKADEAIKSLEEAGKTSKEIGDELAKAQIETILAQAKMKKGEFEEAENLLAGACEVFQSMDKTQDLFESAKQLVLLCLERGDASQAEEYSKEVFAAAAASGDFNLLAEALDLMEKVSMSDRHYAAFYSVFLARIFGRNDPLFQKYFLKVIKKFQKDFKDFRFTEIIGFSEVVLYNLRNARKLKTFPPAIEEVERVFQIANCVGKSRGDKSNSNWRAAERLLEEFGSSVVFGLNVKEAFQGFVL